MQKVSFPQCRRSGGIITVSAAAQVSSFPGPPSECVSEHGWTQCAGCPAGGAAGCSDTGRRGRGRWGVGQAATSGSSSGNWIALRRWKKAPAAAAGDAHENRTSRTRGDGNVRSGLAGRSPIRALSLSRATRTKRLDSALQLGDGAPEEPTRSRPGRPGATRWEGPGPGGRLAS